MSQKVLIVEDDPQLSKFIRLILETKFNFLVLEADNGKKAVEILESELPYLIILDLMLPEMTGHECLSFIRSNEVTKNIPVIVCSAVTNKQLIGELVKLGITDYLLKPITPTSLTNKINEFLKKEREKDEFDPLKK